MILYASTASGNQVDFISNLRIRQIEESSKDIDNTTVFCYIHLSELMQAGFD